MKIAAISDMHGTLPPIPECDLLLIAGDICPATDHAPQSQRLWLERTFGPWLKTQPARKIVGVAGNHDFIFERQPSWVPTLPWTYLQDSSTDFDGFKIWGTPWQPWFFDWAFNLYEPDLVKKWALIPPDTDILIVHGPPHGYGDEAPRDNDEGFEHVGSPGLLQRIRAVKPRLVVYGHIHEGRGSWKDGETILANVTILDASYDHVYEPMVFEL